jgi:plasmid rolling circle replication initiator protein Rep
MEKLSFLKSQSILISNHLSQISSEVSKSIQQSKCAIQLKYIIEHETLIQHLEKANWCRQRSCPICNYIKSIKWRIRIFAGLPKLIDKLKDHHFLFLTLTQKNCHQSDLRLKVKEMEKAWKRFVSSSFPGIGYLKTLEVTRAYDCFYANEYLGRFGSTLIKKWQSSLKFHNIWIPKLWKQYSSEMVHPHIHCLLLVKPDYFNESYLDHLDWVINWRLASRLSYNPSVRIKLVKQQNLNDAIFETTKYCFKPFDLGTDRLGAFLPRQLYGLRLISIGGVFKNYFSQKQLDSIDSNLVSGTEFSQSGMMKVTYDWCNEYSEYSISKIG